MLSGGYTILTMSDWFILFIAIFTVTAYRIYKTEIGVLKHLSRLKPDKEQMPQVMDAITNQVKRLWRITVEGILILAVGVTLFRIFGWQ